MGPRAFEGTGMSMTMDRRRWLLSAAWAVAAGLSAGCSPLAVVDGLLPGETGARRLASDLAFAPGPRRRMDVYGPTTAGDRPRPLLVFTHGGSWASGDKSEYDFVGEAFAAAGFVTVVYNYRLVPEVVFPGFVEDGAAAVAFARRIAPGYGADPDRVILAGHSAGAYTTAMLALDRRFLAEAGVPRRAIRGAVGLAGPYDFLPLDVEATKAAFGAAPDLAATQPVTVVDRRAPPFFLATGADDDTVKPRNTAALAARLRAVGVPVELRTYPDLGHAGILLALAGPLRGRAPVFEEAVAFGRRVAG